MPIDISYVSPGPEPATVSEYSSSLSTKFESAYEFVCHMMGRALGRLKDIYMYDHKVNGKLFEM